MPLISEYKCCECGFSLPTGWGMVRYVTNDQGKRIICPHPVEESVIKRVLGKNPPFELLEKRVGFISYCICLDCLYQFSADLGEKDTSQLCFNHFNSEFIKPKDKRQCPKCGSKNVKTTLEMVGQTCPKCKKVVIEEVYTGMVS